MSRDEVSPITVARWSVAVPEIQSPEKCALRWVNTHVNNFLVCGPKFTSFFPPNVGGVVIYQILFRFPICGSVPEIFAIKLESCQKSRKILDSFLPSQILGGRPSKICTPGSRHVVWIKICDDIPISPEVIDVYTLNFKRNFKFSRLKNFGGTPVPVGVCASKAWSNSSACKNMRA